MVNGTATEGALYKYTPGATNFEAGTWAKLTAPTNFVYTDVGNLSNGPTWFVSGNGGVILRSTDNGVTWTQLQTNASFNLLGIEATLTAAACMRWASSAGSSSPAPTASRRDASFKRPPIRDLPGSAGSALPAGAACRLAPANHGTGRARLGGLLLLRLQVSGVAPPRNTEAMALPTHSATVRATTHGSLRTRLLPNIAVSTVPGMLPSTEPSKSRFQRAPAPAPTMSTTSVGSIIIGITRP